MDFIDQLKQLATRADQLKDKINTEEATKTSLILPFFQLLGYDVFNPMEFVPEYTADVGIKKGERVDYAILIDEKPVILIEAKWCGEKLESHDSQLFRYFGTSPAKFAILTNGLIYRFYTDLDESNKMDLVPFMEFDILDIKEELVPELKKFQKATLDIEAIFSSASDLKYSNSIKQVLSKQFNSPDDAFVNYILSEVYAGRHTQPIIEKFKDIVKRSFSQWVTNILNEKFQTAIECETGK
jgi:predicted type IV restriction endonuclease